MESTMETHITICKTDSQWKVAVCPIGSSSKSSVEAWRCGMGEMGGRFPEGKDICIPATDSC